MAFKMRNPFRHNVEGAGIVHRHGTKIPKIQLPKIKIPKYRVKFNTSRHIPGFVKVTKK
tara:strand:+ start:457 stop:633 length:177 start_codon:yes stop_codon:yes gene_type:complete